MIAVEANPDLVETARIRFHDEIASGQMILVNKAIGGLAGEILTLSVSRLDLGSSSVHEDRPLLKDAIGSYEVEATTIQALMDAHGCPYFMKVDIEGADRWCILPLRQETRPAYLSFEAGADLEELVSHLAGSGYTRFKAINQRNFRELGDQRSVLRQLEMKKLLADDYRKAIYVRIHGRRFLSGHSSGPAPWDSEGRWQDPATLLARWKGSAAWRDAAQWYDIHAA